jgi:hypothetical protein
MKSPRAISAARKTKQAAWRSFSENMAEHLLWESVRALRCGKLRQPLQNLSLIPRLDPWTMARITRHRLLRFDEPRLPAL